MAKKVISALLLSFFLTGIVFAIVHDSRPLEFIYVIILSIAAGALIYGFQHLSPKMKHNNWQFSLVELFLAVTAIALAFSLFRISMLM
jgi:hypothetical protein